MTVTTMMEGQQEPIGIRDAVREAQVGRSGGGGAGGAVGTARAAARMRQQADVTRGLKPRLDAIRLTADGVVPLNFARSSSREEALPGPAGAAHTRAQRHPFPWGLCSWRPTAF